MLEGLVETIIYKLSHNQYFFASLSSIGRSRPPMRNINLSGMAVWAALLQLLPEHLHRCYWQEYVRSHPSSGVFAIGFVPFSKSHDRVLDKSGVFMGSKYGLLLIQSFLLELFFFGFIFLVIIPIDLYNHRDTVLGLGW